MRHVRTRTVMGHSEQSAAHNERHAACATTFHNNNKYDENSQIEHYIDREPTTYFCPPRFKDMNRRQMGKLFNANTMTIPSRPQTTDVNYLEGMCVRLNLNRDLTLANCS